MCHDESIPKIGPSRISARYKLDVSRQVSRYFLSPSLIRETVFKKIKFTTKILTNIRQHDIRTQIRELCGTALSNKSTIPAMFTACMGVTACGDRFIDHAEQKALLDILIKTDIEHMWPTQSAQSHLKRAWGWEDDA